MKKIFFPILLFLINANLLNAQPFTYLDTGNVKAVIFANGELFQDKVNNKAGFEVPKNSNSYSIYSSALWFSSKKIQNGDTTISGAFETFGNINHFNTGPVDLVNQTTDNSQQFQRIWKINQSTIDNHIQNWNNSNYITPPEILDWPGNGNSNNAQNLAPYADLDNDSIYEPIDGEYPIIKGDQAVYLIANDYGRSDTLFPPNTMNKTYIKSAKVEMHLMLYAFDHNLPSISNTVFVHAKLYNRSNSSIDDHDDFKVTIYADFDLGYPVDDYVGTDTTHKLFYSYNGDLYDESFAGTIGYKEKLSAQGVMFLDYDLRHSLYYNSNNGGNGSPQNLYDIYNYQRSLWKYDRKMYFSGNGFNTCIDSSRIVKYIYSGDPTLPNDSTQWTESNPCVIGNSNPNATGDRRMIGGPDTPTQLHHGEMIEFDYAYVFARDDDTSSHISDPVAKLFLVSDTVKNFYDNNILTSIEQNFTPKTSRFTFFPNPSNLKVQLALDETQFDVLLYDLNGRLVKRLTNEKEFSVAELSEGIYFLRIESEKIQQTEKLIIQR